ncbi:transporter [Clostridia bacterium]|nr:transporter [Clostridia bacterium]
MLILLALGIYLTIKTRFFQVFRFKFIFERTVGTLLKRDKRAGHGITPFQAMTTALAGTMGVGNIAGVATALVSGGPGAIFWMWAGAFFGMATKYAEIYLAVLYRRRDADGRFTGGPMYYMRNGLGENWLAALFSVLCVLTSLGIGNMAQVNSVSSSMSSAFTVPPAVSGILAAGCVALAVFGGVKRIAKITEAVIPFIAVIYICFAGTLLYINRGMLTAALSQIILGAFGVRAAGSGALGYTVSQAVRLGLSRGVFTNEAGLGSAPMAHAAADTKSPAHQGAWGVFEVFLDTMVVCTVTALVLLTAKGGTLWRSGLNGALLTSAAFESVFGGLGESFIALSIVFFAIPSMLGWCYYGECAMSFLTNGSGGAVNLYRAAFCVCVALGSVIGTEAVWAASDILNSLMALPNVAAVFLLSGQVTAPGAEANPQKRGTRSYPWRSPRQLG